MMTFEEYIARGIVKKVNVNMILTKAIAKTVEKRKMFIQTTQITDITAIQIIENSYDIVQESIEMLLAEQGYKYYSHEATCIFAYEKKYLTLEEYQKIDELRKARNGMKYYGKEGTIQEAENAKKLMERIYRKIKETKL